ncbi:MAG: hypothetical protein GY866_36680 [Proteobacteria bacterium]|nr:hypothetical protein [Pseudomonadota bacterium]
MHDMPDTEDADADAERFWPEDFKTIIRNRIKDRFSSEVLEAEAYRTVFEEQYRNRFSDYESFVARLAEMMVIGAENGADEIFDEIYDSFRKQLPLPNMRSYARYYQPVSVDRDLKTEVAVKIVEEYKDLHAYEHIYEDHFQRILSFDEFINSIAGLVANGVANGADDALGKIYRSFLTKSPLPLLRRYPRRIR